MLDSNCQTTINTTGKFELRRAVERLRDGLFDPLGIKLLTMGEAKLAKAFDRGAAAVEKGKAAHLCLCGAYGQGKSHSLNYIKQRALDQGFAVSYINLDPREVPFHQFKDVYRALMENTALPGNNDLVTAWKEYAAHWLALPENRSKTCLDLVPEKIPHRFKAILTAMAGKNMAIPNGKKHLKKHARFKPREFPRVLKNALMGNELPAWRIRPALYYRQVSFYREHSLVCRRSDQYLDAILGMAELFRDMGFKGWVLLFDEGEAIGQARITARSRSYRLLDRMFSPDPSAAGFYPVFAFTHDFFHRVAEEEYDRVRIKRKRDKKTDTTVEEELPYFDRDYHAAWKNITVHSLHALSSREWQALIGKLIRLHGGAYNWHPPAEELQQAMEGELSRHRGSESRLKLKLLVNHLDLVHQEQFLAEQP